LLVSFDATSSTAATAGVTYQQALEQLVDACILLFTLGYRRVRALRARCVRALCEGCLSCSHATPARAAARSEDSLRAELDALAAASAGAVPPDAGERVAGTAVLVFLTLQSCPPATVTRWSHAAPVSEQSIAAWFGFCRHAPPALLPALTLLGGGSCHGAPCN
jgi:hypothetical protein